MSFASKLPLPRPDKIPNNAQIASCYSELEQQFSQIDPDQMIQLMYRNCIVPKINQQARSQKSYHSKVSGQSGNSRTSSKLFSFTVHPNNSHIRQPPQEEEDETIKKKKKKRRKKPKEEHRRQLPTYQLKTLKGENQQNLKKAQQWKKTQKQHHFKESEPAQFRNKEQSIKYQQKKLAAKAFCERGHGLDKLKEQVWQNQRKVLQMSKSRYQSILFNFMSESFRSLQKFLIQDCNRTIKPLTHAEIKALIPCLTHGKLRMNEDQYLTLRKFISITFNLGSVSIFQQMAVNLYIRAQLLLRGKIGPNRLERQYKSQEYQKKQMLRSPGRFLNQRLENDTVWTKQLEFQLLDLLIQLKAIAKARQKLRQKYGLHPILSSVKELKARYFKILRISAKRLLKLTKEQRKQLPPMVPFDDEKVKVMIRHPTAKDARQALSRLYKVDGFPKNLLSDAILKVNQFCRLEDKRRQSQMREKEPVINSITDKIKHNIKVSSKLLHNVTAPAERVGPDQELLYVKKSQESYQHIVSLQHEDKLHYFRRTGKLNSKGGFEYQEKDPELRKLQIEDGDDNSEYLVEVSDDDYVSEGSNSEAQQALND